MNKETRFVWLVLLMVTVVTLALRSKHDDYDPDDRDRIFTEGPPPTSNNILSCVPGFGFASFGITSDTINDSASTNSYNSTAGSYFATRVNDDGNVGTDGVPDGSISATSSANVRGLCETGGGNVNGGGHCQNTTTTVPPLASFAPAVAPVIGVNLGAQALAAGPTTLLPNNTYTDITCAGCNLTLNPGIYVIDSLTMANSSTLTVTGPVIVYFNTFLTFQDSSNTNSGPASTNLVFLGTATATAVTVKNSTNVTAAIYAPTAAAIVQDSADLFGSVVGLTVVQSNSSTIHYDQGLAGYTAPGFGCGVPTEVSRASPIVATITTLTGPHDAVVQGTYNLPFPALKQIATLGQVGSFTFPYITGHMRARTVASIGTAETTFSTGVIGTEQLFDAATAIPPTVPAGCATFNGTCRHIFTTFDAVPLNGVTFHPTVFDWKDSNASTIGPLMAATADIPGIAVGEWTTIMHTVLNGGLGGVDRSTVAVIPSSQFAGVSTRPTIVYFGATDGMLHAVCASLGGTTPSQANICPNVGTEIWAFMPRVELPLVRFNATRIDGSIRVNDAFGNFTAVATNPKSFRTILTFQTGYSVGTVPATYALDVTDPAAPVVVWEHTTQSVPAVSDFGTGLVMASGSTLIASQTAFLAVAETNNGGTGASGMTVTAMDQQTGNTVWQFANPYVDVPTINASGLPGGAVGVDLAGQGFVTDYVMGDLTGALWKINAVDGTSRSGATVPWFKFTTGQHPIGAVPAIYSDGNSQFALFGSGGYVDPLNPIISFNHEFLISVKLTAGVAPPTLDETTVATPNGFVQPILGKVFAQPLIVGKQAFVTTSGEDVNSSGYGTHGDTGQVLATDLTSATGATVVFQAATRGGASSLANSGTTLISSTADQQQTLTATATSATNGTGVTPQAEPKITKMLWLRTL